MTHLTRVLIFSALLLVSACAQPTKQSIDSSVETAIAETITVLGTPTQRPGIEFGPPATSIFCPGCQLVRVTGIVDGDTIDTSIGRVRFFGVDTPERGEQCFTEATEFTRLLVGAQLRLEDGPRLADSYGRRLAYVYDASGNSLEVQMIAAGYAKAWTRDGQHRDMFIGLEENARRNNAGCLWARG
jgi:endonuclease YncB( thermonuclease family)